MCSDVDECKEGNTYIAGVCVFTMIKNLKVVLMKQMFFNIFHYGVPGIYQILSFFTWSNQVNLRKIS